MATFFYDRRQRRICSADRPLVMVTHDVDEAVLLSDRIVVMTNGSSATIGGELSIELQRPRIALS